MLINAITVGHRICTGNSRCFEGNMEWRSIKIVVFIVGKLSLPSDFGASIVNLRDYNKQFPASTHTFAHGDSLLLLTSTSYHDLQSS